MVPTLAPGEFVLVDSRRVARAGDVVVARHPSDFNLLVIKRVADVNPDRRLVLSSDNPAAGTDSRVWGPIDVARIVGVVTVVLDRLTSAELGGALNSKP